MTEKDGRCEVARVSCEAARWCAEWMNSVGVVEKGER